ncbi:MAG: hypothetical protein Q8P73_00765 [bacterium]|nr:hypothetical protein [bacterium]
MNIRSTIKHLSPVSLLALPGIVLAQGLTTVPAPQGTAQNSLVNAVTFLLNGLLILAALAAVVFLILGGFRYIFSQGDEDQSSQAKNTILYAVLGLIVIGLAAAVVNFVVGAIQGA